MKFVKTLIDSFCNNMIISMSRSSLWRRVELDMGRIFSSYDFDMSTSWCRGHSGAFKVLKRERLRSNSGYGRRNTRRNSESSRRSGRRNTRRSSEASRRDNRTSKILSLKRRFRN
jgi:hypothetical protein